MATNKMSDFDTPDDTTHNEAQTDAAHVVQAREIHGNVVLGQATDSSSLPVPQMLPPDSPHFIGRSAEKRMLDELLSTGQEASNAVVISAVAGTAGLGKTALAVHWAHGVRDQFPDGQLYLNLRGHDSGPRVSTGEALDRLLRALRVPGRHIPQGVDEKAELYRSLLSGKRILVVLDNVDLADQVRGLLPSSTTCMVLVTSRSRLSGLVARDGAHRINLGLLSPDESISLLNMIIGAQRCDRDPSSVRELAQRCAHLPLALRIAGERAVARPHLPLTELVAELADEQRRLDLLAIEEDESMAVRAVFSWSYRLLQEDVALTFRRLGLHPGPDFGVHVAAALAGCTVNQVRPRLNLLVSVHLIEEVGLDRYAFHDLLRIYALETSELLDSEENIAASVDRMYAWYLHSAHAMYSVLSPHTAKWSITGHSTADEPMQFVSSFDALQWGDAEASNLIAATRSAAESGDHSSASQLPIVMSTFLLVRSRWSEMIYLLHTGIASSVELDDPKAEVWNLLVLDVVHVSIDEFDKALPTSIRALRIAQKLSNRWAEGAALHDLGMVFDGLGRLDEAVDHLRRALDIYRAIGDRRGEGTVLALLGDVLRRRHEFDSAQVHSLQGLSIHRSTNNLLGEAYALRQIGRLYAETGRVDEAVDSVKSAASIFKQLQHQYEYARALQQLGSIELDAGRISDARMSLQKAHAILQELNLKQADAVRAHLDSLNEPEL